MRIVAHARVERRKGTVESERTKSVAVHPTIVVVAIAIVIGASNTTVDRVSSQAEVTKSANEVRATIGFEIVRIRAHTMCVVTLIRSNLAMMRLREAMMS